MRKLDENYAASAYAATSRRVIFLAYGGTLVDMDNTDKCVYMDLLFWWMCILYTTWYCLQVECFSFPLSLSSHSILPLYIPPPDYPLPPPPPRPLL